MMAADGEEDFVGFGTPLEPLEEDEPLKKPVPLHEQTVRDEKGRQRFHGAFTGGFSAGYYNTVGSKEGWTPSTFVSSRQQKKETHHARPEDFMDEEDFGEHGIAPREIRPSQEFWSRRSDPLAEKARAVGAQAATIAGDVLLEALVAPARSTMGAELLKKMGWKEGQGVGPRVKRKPRRQLPGGASETYSCAPPPAGSEESETDDDDFAPEDVTFAPKDVTPVDFTPRLGVQGLGYRGLNPGLALPGQTADEHVDLFRPQADGGGRLFGGRGERSRRGGVVGQAFGVGALEDEDEDVYHRDSMSRYDTVLGEEEPGDGLYGWTAPQQYRKTERSRDAAYLGKILEGFTLALKTAEEKTVFPPPTLPRDYRPVHHFRPPVEVTRMSGVSAALAGALMASRGHMAQEEPQRGGRHQLDSGQRRTLLGENVLAGPASVMDLLRPEDKQRLLNLRGAGPGTPPPPPSLHQEALAAWRGSAPSSSSESFKPFEKNPSKQQRYDLYLSGLRQGDAAALERSLDPAMTEWERSRERDEFVRASVLYRPSSSSLSSRFARGKHQEDEDAVEVDRDQEGDTDDKQTAVGMKMFGKLTRETWEWHPDRLLCKRFNVPDPYPGSALVGLPKVKRDKFSVFNFLTVPESREPTVSKPLDSGKKSRWDVSEQKEETASDETLGAEQNRVGSPAAVGTSKDESTDEPRAKDEEEEEEEEERPPMDLFKAIFVSSSSSSQEESDEDEEGGAEPEPETLFSTRRADFPSMPASPTSSGGAAAASTRPSNREEGEEFGPKLPPPGAALAADRGGAAAAVDDMNASRRSKEKKYNSKKQQKHKKEKKKKKHKKNKGKQQKKSKRAESDGSSEDGREDAEPSTDELLKRLKSIRTQKSR